MAAVDVPADARLAIAVDVPSHRISRNAHLTGHSAHRVSLYQHLVSDNIDLVHPQHPPAESPAPRADNLRSLGWISFSPPSGSLSRRHDHGVRIDHPSKLGDDTLELLGTNAKDLFQR